MSVAFKLAILLILIMVTSVSFNGYATDAEFNKIFRLIYNQQYTEALTELKLSADELDYMEFQLLQIDLYWWKAISSNSPDDFRVFEQVLNSHITKIATSQVQKDFNELVHLGYSIRFSALRNHYFTLFADIFKINRLLKQLEEIPLSRRDSEIFDVVKAIFNIGKSKISFNSELKKNSMLVLEARSQSSNLTVKTISSYFLAKMYLEIEKEPGKAKRYFDWLSGNYPQNKIFRHFKMICDNQSGQA